MKFLLAFLLLSSTAFSSELQKNKDLAREFFELAFNKHRPAEAAQKFLTPEYKQHNPHAPTGSKAFVDYFEPFFKENKNFRMSIKRIMADGDLVIIHSHAQMNESDRGNAVVDILRVKDGKFVEHWDVIQEIPEKSANSNTMF